MGASFRGAFALIESVVARFAIVREELVPSVLLFLHLLAIVLFLFGLSRSIPRLVLLHSRCELFIDSVLGVGDRGAQSL
ncbi:hypothetical protein LB505_005003 [Fusarium chuoi]|nr:hypothetical protein LB505_005003 [Fusarium chuoi]